MSSGIGIALAWPETLCKQAGAWYDKPLKWLNINKNNYYKVGHAAIVLVDPNLEKCHYFDFGRYHAPHQHGRVRSEYTDHDLEIDVKPKFNDQGELTNIQEILYNLYLNESCHGTGNLHASLTKLNFERAFEKAQSMQLVSPLPYGPFVLKGTNCSRFVNTVLIAGKPDFITRLKLLFPFSFSPTPIGNVKSLKNYSIISEQSLTDQYLAPIFKLSKYASENINL